MWGKTYIGIDLRPDELNFLAVRKRGKELVLVDGGSRTLEPGTLRPNFNAPNIQQPETLAAVLRESVTPFLGGHEKRVSVALPDHSGRTFIIDVDTPFKHRGEGLEVIRWQLKEHLPGKLSEYKLDYQVIADGQAGLKKILVAVISGEVLEQYENTLEQAGLAPAVIDFHSLAVYNAYRSKIDLGEDFILITLDDGQLGLMVFVNRALQVCRCRPVTTDLREISREINRSLVTPRQQLSGFARMPVCLHSDWSEPDSLHSTIESLFEQNVQLLISPVGKLSSKDGTPYAQASASCMTAALGAAERLIKGVS